MSIYFYNFFLILKTIHLVLLMKCTICGKGKAKRFCPAKNSNICAKCCGEKRGIEINCPLDCEYFIEGQRHQQQKIAKQRIQKEGVESYIRRAELYTKNPEIFALIEFALANMFRANRKLNNKDVVRALEQVYKTLETEKKGIYYDHTGENSYANEISTAILAIIRDQLSKRRSAGMNLEFLSSVVEELLNEAKFYVKTDPNPQSYLILIARQNPDKKESRQRDSGIIISP